MRTSMATFRNAFLGLSALLMTWSLGTPISHAAPPPPEEMAAAEAEQDKALSEAQRGGSTARVVVTYESRLTRQTSVLNRYLYGRALFHHGDKPGAMREMRAVVEAEPDFWQAQVRLAYLYLEGKNLTLARQHLDRARAKAPDNDTVLLVAAEIGHQTHDWDLALAALKPLVAHSPQDARLRMQLADVYRSKGDWTSSYTELRALRLMLPKDGRVRAVYAHAAFRAGRLDEAAVEFEALVKDDASGAPLYLQVLQQIAFDRKDWPALISVLERRRAFMKPEEKALLEHDIQALKAGHYPGEKPTATDTPRVPTAEEQTLALIDRCLSPDVQVRRAALQDFHTAALGWVPKAILVRYHPQEEPDPECRAWVVRIVGALRNDMTAKVPGHALQDEQRMVRSVAAAALGEIGTPAGVLYLVAYWSDLPLAADAPPPVVEEFNAARQALVTLTGFDDLEIGAPRWVPAAGLEASRKRWDEWFASPAGTDAKVKAIADLIRTGETHPEWYLLVQMYDTPAPVAHAAYDALLARSAQPATDPVAQRFWPSFPRLRAQADGKDLTSEESFADVRTRIKAWWTKWLEARRAETK